MPTRRQVILAIAALTGGTVVYTAGSFRRAASRYNEAVRNTWLFSGSSGNPVVPRWLGMKLLNLFFAAKSENEKYAKHIRSSAGIAVFVSDHSNLVRSIAPNHLESHALPQRDEASWYQKGLLLELKS